MMLPRLACATAITMNASAAAPRARAYGELNSRIAPANTCCHAPA
jgi:hypothetical protein